MLLALACSACATLSPAQRAHRAARSPAAARSTAIDCDRADACAQPSPLHALAARALAESTPAQPRHYALILDYGQDALLARLNLIRSATTSIDLQTYIFDEDDAGHLVLDELLAAARRGVKVRVLVDQLSALKRIDTLAALAGAHANFAIRVYNPVLGRARINYPQYLLAAACCWRKLNQRMHSKLLLVDGAVGITGGRNYQDDYYDWDASYNFRDRDVLVAGPAVARRWRRTSTRSGPTAAACRPSSWPMSAACCCARACRRCRRRAFERPRAGRGDVARCRRSGAGRANARRCARCRWARCSYLADLPQKHRREQRSSRRRHRPALRALIESAHDRSAAADAVPGAVEAGAAAVPRPAPARRTPPRVIVSTNSLAADRLVHHLRAVVQVQAPLPARFRLPHLRVQAVPGRRADRSRRHRRVCRQCRDDGTRAGAAEPALSRAQRQRRDAQRYRAAAAARIRAHCATPASRANEPVPLQRAGVRIGLHAKSLVVDERIGVVGTHNFDPRGDHYNTESAVVIDDPAFARALARSIRRDIAPDNSWTIARRDKPPVFSGLEYSLAKISERLPIFDLWPVRYATSYEFQPGPQCPAPLPPDDPRFRECYRPVGDFPEVSLGLKSLLTRIFTAFGAGLAPIL